MLSVTLDTMQTTPGDYLEEGRVLAAKLCSLWNLPLPATKSALEALEGLVHVSFTYDCMGISPWASLCRETEKKE